MRETTSGLPVTPATDIRTLQLPIPVPPRPRRSGPVRTWLRSHRTDMAGLVPLLSLAGIVQAAGMDRAPQYTDVEGGNTAQAYSLDTSGGIPLDDLSFDSSPLGGMQIAAWTRLTGAFDRADHAVAAGREAMLVATLVSVVLLWVLARRLGLPRSAAAVAVSIFSLSPLALHVHRMVYVDNLAMMWTLAALALATARRRQLLAFSAAGVAAVLAVLTQVTFLVFTPFVVWSMWQLTGPRMRRGALAVAGATLAVVGYAYILITLVGRESRPGEERLGSWWELDPVLLALAPVVAVAALAVAAFRPAAGSLILALLLIALPSGATPVSLVIPTVALTAILAPAVVHRLAVRLRRLRGRAELGPLGIMSATAIAAVALAAAMVWPGQVRELVRADPNAPMAQAGEWLESNVAGDSRLIVDRTMWLDLIRARFARENVVAFDDFAADDPVLDSVVVPGTEEPTEPALPGWRHHDYIVSTASMRSDPESRLDVGTAMEESSVVAVFGVAEQRVEIRQIHPLGLEAAEAVAAGERRSVMYAAGQLLRNAALHFDVTAETALEAGMVDPRIVIVLGQLAGTYDLTVSLPSLPGEDAAPRREMVLRDVGSADAAARLGLWLLGQPAPFTPTGVDVDGADVTATYSFAPPGGLLPDPPQSSE